MKKRLILLAVSLVVLIVTIVAILYVNGTFSTMDPSDFSIEDTDRIGKIYLADRKNNTILLERKAKGEWIVNGKYKARQSAVDELLRTMRIMRARAPVAEAASDNVARGMSVENTKVEAYDKDGDLIKAFFVGAETEGGRGNYMMREGADEIFVVQIPGFHGVLHTRFFTDVTEWRDRTVFSYEPREIAQIKVEYPRWATSSFRLEVIARDSFGLVPLSPEGAKLDEKPAMTEMAAYLNNFSNLKAEAFLNEHPQKDSILATQPFCQIEVTDTAGNVNSAKFYYKPVSKRTKMQSDREGEPIPFDPERSFALINNGQDFVLAQQFVFGKVMKRYEDFFDDTSQEGEVF